MKKSICVIGLGYIGLPAAALFAYYGHNVVGVDINESIVNKLNEGNVTIAEPGLNNLVRKVVQKGKLIGSTVPIESELFIIAVPTPISKDKKADLSYIKEATKSILPYIKKGNIIVLESTSPMGTTEEVVKPILEEYGFKIGEDIYLGYCPERVIPGKIIKEMVNNSRVIGGINVESAIKIKEIYETMVKGKIFITNCKTAEMCKLMENTFRDVNIALSNELAKICEKNSINAWEVIEYCNEHPRVQLMNPGPGVGGHCIAVDPWFIVEKESYLANIIHMARDINDSMPIYVYNKIMELLKNNQGKKVTILGITYKENIDDIRESPIIKIIDKLVSNNIQVDVYDPYAKLSNISKDNIINACENSDLVVLGVSHNQFKNMPLDEISKAMKGKIILDTRNYLNQEDIEKNGLIYELLGS
ncbi:MAG: nucleotide sugar dehydrogenase [Romboutsia sp.]|uniref:nucleotide sugar dehydrogenase n=1 Tax=Romboutsia sp. TaxID=1965302 RepID=UPI003F2CAE78